MRNMEDGASSDEDELDDQVLPSISPKRTSEKSHGSSMRSFLEAIGKKDTPSSSSVRATSRASFNEEMVAYRSLAQREYNSIVDGDKEPNVVSVTWLKVSSLLQESFFVSLFV